MIKRKVLVLFLFFYILFTLSLLLISLRQKTNVKYYAANSYYPTLPPGSALPDDATCAARVIRNPWEPRSDNIPKNLMNEYNNGHTNTGAATYLQGEAPAIAARITGNFTGTTDEIFQWAACKWGFDIDTIRAQAVSESYWHQSQLGDSASQTQPGLNGHPSVGILQVKGGDIPPTHPGTWPYAWDSTSWNVDYTLAVRRACFEGKETWLGNGYAAGDLWGCIGRWYSGGWHDSGAENYIASVKNHMANQDWNTFGAGPAPTFPNQAPSTIVSTPTPSTSSGSPTGSPSPTSTIPPGATTFFLTLCPHGIANCGDNANPQSTGNMNPLHPQRPITVSVSDINNNPITTGQGTVTFNPDTGTFKGTVPLSGITSGEYIVKVTMAQYLTKQIGIVQQITTGQTNTTPEAFLIAGDINGDNKLNIMDYSILVSCFGSKATTPSCNNQQQVADIDDDRKVDGIDYNLFLRELSVQNGQ